MTNVSIEVAADPAATTGGRALILIKGLDRLPSSPGFLIEPIDETVMENDASGWPTGERQPIDMHLAADGVHMLVGADIVDAPLLQPGTPVTIVIPSENLRADLRWPNVPVSTAHIRRPAVLTVEQRAAALKPAPVEDAKEALAPPVDVAAIALEPNAEVPPRSDILETDPVQPVSIESAAAGACDAELAADPVRDAAPVETAVDRAAAVAPTGADIDALHSDAPPSNALLPNALVPAPPAPLAVPHIAGHPAPRRRRGMPAVLGWATVVACGLTAVAWLAPGSNLLDIVRRAETHAVPPALDAAFHAGPVSPRGQKAAGVDIDTALRIAEANLHGIGKPVDREEAKYWLSKSLEIATGDDQTKWVLTQLGSLYARPASGAPDYVTARALWMISAAQGDAVALCFLGKVEEGGLGGPVDRQAAITHYEQSRALGACTEAEAALARLRN